MTNKSSGYINIKDLPKRPGDFWRIAENGELLNGTEEWAKSKILTTSQLLKWAKMCPLPIGKNIFYYEVMANRGRFNSWETVSYEHDAAPIVADIPAHHSAEAIFKDSLPFDGDERAVYIREFKSDDVSVTFFGLSEITDTYCFDKSVCGRCSDANDRLNKQCVEADGEPYSIIRDTIVGCKLIVMGADLRGRNVKNAIYKLEKWWAKFEGKPVPKPGRPEDTTYKTFKEVRNAMLILTHNNGETPSQEALASFLRIGRTTLQEYCNVNKYPNHMTWQQLKDWAKANQ